MLKRSLVAAGALVLGAFVTAVTSSGATAAAPTCKNKVNQYVACTDRLKTKIGQNANQTRPIRTMPLWGLRARSRF